VHSQVKKLYPIFVEEAEALVRTWVKVCNNTGIPTRTHPSDLNQSDSNFIPTGVYSRRDGREAHRARHRAGRLVCRQPTRTHTSVSVFVCARASVHAHRLLTWWELVRGVGQQMSYVTLDIIGLTAFGFAFNCVKGSTSEVRSLVGMPSSFLDVVDAITSGGGVWGVGWWVYIPIWGWGLNTCRVYTGVHACNTGSFSRLLSSLPTPPGGGVGAYT